MPYTAATIPYSAVRDMLNDNWDIQNGSVPEPNYVVINDGNEPIRIDMNQGDHIVIRPDIPAEKEQPIGAWVYGNRAWAVSLELITKNSRQRLWDLKDEVRRICHLQMHSLTNFQRIQYMNFTEYIETEQLMWRGRIQLELISNAELLETTNP